MQCLSDERLCGALLTLELQESVEKLFPGNISKLFTVSAECRLPADSKSADSPGADVSSLTNDMDSLFEESLNLDQYFDHFESSDMADLRIEYEVSKYVLFFFKVRSEQIRSYLKKKVRSEQMCLIYTNSS